MMTGMGVLLRVCRWWICVVPLITLGDVASCDVDGTFTLCSAVACTLGDGAFVMMLVRSRNT